MRYLALIAWCGIVACGAPGEEPPPRPDPGIDTAGPETGSTDEVVPVRPNLLVLFTDDQGVDKVGAYDEHWSIPSTPNIDGLAEQGVLFRRAYAAPVCTPARGVLLTGRYGRRHGLGEVIHPHASSKQMRRDQVTLADALGDVGYHAEALGKWHLAGFTSPDGPAHPLAVGFAHHRGAIGNLQDTHHTPEQPTSYDYWEKSIDGELAFTRVYATTDTVDDAIARIAEMPEPWLLYVAFHAPHTPLTRPPDHLHGVDLSDDPPPHDIYDAMVEALDTEIGRLLSSMDPDVRARTDIVFTSDNGTSIFGATPPTRINRVKNTPFEGGIRVPLIVSGPSVPHAGVEVDALVHLVDLFPTLLELASVDPEAVAGADGAPLRLDGISLVPYLKEPTIPPMRSWVYAEKFGPNGPPPYNNDWRILRDERWKLVRGYGAEERFFDLLEPGTEDGLEGDDLLATELDDEAREAWERLSLQLDVLLADMVFEELQ